MVKQAHPFPRRGASYRLLIGAIVLSLDLGASATAASDDPRTEHGRILLEENCSRCHAIGISGASQFVPAPPFRTLEERYPLENLEEALAEGIVSGHPAMPEFAFDPDQIGAIIAYLKSLHR
jgi:cytochrome c